MLSLLHHLLATTAHRTPDRVALVDGDKERTYGDLWRRVSKVASALRDLGVRPGDRVATWLSKCGDEVESLLAISACGGVFVDINPLLKAPQVRHILRDSGAVALVTQGPRLRAVAGIAAETPDLRLVLLSGRAPTEQIAPISGTVPVISLSEARGSAHRIKGGAQRIDVDPAGILYTSGSTGLPKGVVVSHRNLLAGAACVASYLRNDAEDSVLSVLPLSFDYGLNQLTTMLLVGGQLVLQPYLGPADILAAAARRRITGLAGIPPIWSALLALDWSEAALGSLRYITNSGGVFPVEHVREYRRRLPKTDIYLMYGLTEAFRSTFLPPDQVDVRPGSMGKAVPNAEILVVDEQGRPCGPGEVGELVHRGAHVALGYWNDPERTAERFRPNPVAAPGQQVTELVVYSGDLVRRDEEGWLYFVGRRDGMIKTSGFRVSPTEVEDAFHATGLVQDAVAFGVPDRAVGQRIHVVCSLLPTAAAADVMADDPAAQDAAAVLKGLVSNDLPSYMAPARVEVRAGLPRNANGKVDRARIVREAAEAQAAEAQAAEAVGPERP